MELAGGYYYHLDTCFCPLAPGEAIISPVLSMNTAVAL